MNTQNINIKILPASYGDCFLVSINDGENCKNILIDGGIKNTYINFLKYEIIKLSKKDKKIDLLINTHIDADHIKGLITFLIDNNNEKIIDIDDIWFNGLEQVINNDSILSKNIDIDDEKIINNISKKGYNNDSSIKKEISSEEGVSFSGLIKFGAYNHNKISNSKAISTDLNKIKLSENVFIKIINPNKDKLEALKKKWLEELSRKQFRFSVPKNEKLVSSFEFILSRLHYYYKNNEVKSSSSNEIDKYLSDLKNKDKSVVNSSSISFVLEVGKKRFLFLGDSVIFDKDKCSITNELLKEYGKNTVFELIKLPHHGSNHNISKDFIELFSAKEYLISTNSEKFNHPDSDVIGNLINKDKNHKNFIFNYPHKVTKIFDNDTWKKKYNYSLIIGDGESIINRSY